MAEVAEAVNDVEHIEKETEKKVVDVEDDKTEKKEKDLKPKENGKAETNEKSETETNGSTDTTEAVTATKRKSGAGDAPDGTPAEGATPEKKAKISNDEEKEKDSTNGESEVASEGAGEAKNMSYQKHF